MAIEIEVAPLAVTWHRFGALAGSALVLAAGCARLEETRHCADASECSPDSFCRGGRCVASARPVSRVVGPAASPAPSHTVLRFDGASSADPDPEDHLTLYAWTLRSLAASCDPFPATGNQQALDAVFGCAGTFEVRLVVTDSTGRDSEPAVLAVAVVLSSAVPTVKMGADLFVDHACAGDPLLCGALPEAGAADLRLSASATSPTGSPIAYAWSYTAPPLHPGQPAPRVLLDPPDGPAPALRIETDGGPIAGDYLFTVQASDDFHLVAVGQQRVTVGNRPPVISGGGTIEVPHGFDPVARRLVAAGAVPPFTVVDPDGDPVTSLGFTASHAGDRAGLFEVASASGGATFAISVPYAVPPDAASLIGGPGLTRTIGLLVVDANGARAAASWDVLVTNRPPRLVGAPGPLTVNHFFDAAGARYRASAALLTAVDDDGDPIVQMGPTGDADCALIPEVVGAGAISVECARAYAGPASLAPFLAAHPVAVVVGDPWTVLRPGTARVSIANRPPRVIAAAVPLGLACGPVHCCRADAGGCVAFQASHSAGSATLPVTALDDDGDPVTVDYAPQGCARVDPASATCVAGTCGPVEASVCAETPACGAYDYRIAVTASDGVGSASGELVLEPGCVSP